MKLTETRVSLTILVAVFAYPFLATPAPAQTIEVDRRGNYLQCWYYDNGRRDCQPMGCEAANNAGLQPTQHCLNYFAQQGNRVGHQTKQLTPEQFLGAAIGLWILNEIDKK